MTSRRLAIIVSDYLGVTNPFYRSKTRTLSREARLGVTPHLKVTFKALSFKSGGACFLLNPNAIGMRRGDEVAKRVSVPRDSPLRGAEALTNALL